jgi:hypothetical protein
VARGKFRSAPQEGGYYLNDADLEGRYIDGLKFDARSPRDAGGEQSEEPDGDEATDDLGDDAGDEDFDDPGDDGAGTGESVGDAGGGAPAGAGDYPSLRVRLAKAIAPKPVGPGAPRPVRTPPPRSTDRQRPADRQARKPVVIPEGKTIEDLINNLDSRERMISLVAAVLGVAYAIFIAIYYAHPPKGKTQVNAELVAAIMGVPALLTGVAVFILRRALVGFLALLTGFAMLTYVGIYGLIYFAVGFWLIMKAQKYSRYAREQAGGDVRPRRDPKSKPDRSTRGGSAKAPASKSRTAAPARKAPVASKRYTPPRSAAPAGRRTQAR